MKCWVSLARACSNDGEVCFWLPLSTGEKYGETRAEEMLRKDGGGNKLQNIANTS